MTLLATSGKRLEIIGKALAQEAQNAAGAIRAADRNPNLPRRIGIVAISFTHPFSTSSQGNLPKISPIASIMPASWCLACHADSEGGVLRWHLGLAHGGVLKIWNKRLLATIALPWQCIPRTIVERSQLEFRES